jgi:hypothetical protein
MLLALFGAAALAGTAVTGTPLPGVTVTAVNTSRAEIAVATWKSEGHDWTLRCKAGASATAPVCAGTSGDQRTASGTGSWQGQKLTVELPAGGGRDFITVVTVVIDPPED